MSMSCALYHEADNGPLLRVRSVVVSLSTELLCMVGELGVFNTYCESWCQDVQLRAELLEASYIHPQDWQYDI